MSMRLGLFLLGASCALGWGIQDASARTLQVGTCTSASPTFSTIQSAVDAAFAGDKVTVCPGSYAEQVVISRSLTLTNVSGMASPTIVVPNGGVVQNTVTVGSQFPTAAQILVSPSGPATVKVMNLVVDGTGNNDTSCGLELMGIYYQNSGGAISDNTVQNEMLPDGYQGCQDGEGIFVENATAGTGAIQITGNTLTNFDKNGITLHLGAAKGTISQNSVTGIGPTDVIAQNGIEIAYGATATVTGNFVSNLIYSPGTYGSSGILLYDTQASSYLATPIVERNTVSSAQYGVVLDAVDGTAVNPVQIKSNVISDAQFAAVGLYSDNSFNPGLDDDNINVMSNRIQNTDQFDGIDACSDNNSITKNTVDQSTESAIHLDGECTEPDNSTTGVENSVSSNHIDQACVGILSGPAQGANTIGHNSYTSVTTQIVYGQDSASCPSARKPGASKVAAATKTRRAVKPVRY